MKKTNQDVVGEKCIRNDEGNLASTEEKKKLAWKSHYEKLLNTEFDWDRDNFVRSSSSRGASYAD